MNHDYTEIKLSSLSPDTLSACFTPCMDTDVCFCDDGMRLTARRDSRDPSVMFRAVTLMKEVCGADAPADASELGAMVVKVQTSLPGYFEIFFTCGDVTVPTVYHTAGNEYVGCGTEYVLCDFAAQTKM